MANKTISDLTTAIEVADSDNLLIENDTVTMKASKAVLLQECSKNGHGHEIGEINLLQDALDGKMDDIELATVATSGSYSDLTDTPSIPTKVSELQNDNGYLTAVPSTYITEEELAAELAQKSDIDHIHKYEEITGVPSIPSKVSELENDKKYLTQSDLTPLFLNVKEFGAKGDGVANDTQAIEQALAEIDNVGGGTLYFPSGTYCLNYFCLRENLHLHIETGATLKALQSVLCSNFLSTETNVTLYNGRSNIIIDGGGVIDMDGLTVRAAGTVVQFGHCKNITIKDITFKNICCDHAIEFCGVDSFIMDNCKFINYIDTVNDGSKIYKEAIQIDYCGVGHGGGGVQDNTPSKNGIIKNCIFTKDSDDYNYFPTAIGSHGDDILSEFMENIIVSDNIIEYPLTYGVTPLYWSNSKIINNIIKGQEQGIAIAINKTTMTEISGNIINNFGDGIGCYSASSNINITNNIINTIQKHGIHYSGGSNNGFIRDNLIMDVNLINESYSAIAIGGVSDTDYTENVIITGNTIRSTNNNIGFGIDIRSASKNIAYSNNNLVTYFTKKPIQDLQESSTYKKNDFVLFSGEMYALGAVTYNNSYTLSDFDAYEILFNANGVESRTFASTERYPKLRTFNMVDNVADTTINFYEMAINMNENNFEITLNNVQNNIGTTSATKELGTSGSGIQLLKIIGIKYDDYIGL